VAVSETDADAVVIAVEITDEGFYRCDRGIRIDVVEDEHEVGVVARNRTVGGRKTHHHFALVGEFEFVDLAVDAAARGQETLHLGTLVLFGRHGCGHRRRGCRRGAEGARCGCGARFCGESRSCFRRGFGARSGGVRSFRGHGVLVAGGGFFDCGRSGPLHCGEGLFRLRCGAERDEYR